MAWHPHFAEDGLCFMPLLEHWPPPASVSRPCALASVLEAVRALLVRQAPVRLG
jgi:hypothetical protein